MLRRTGLEGRLLPVEDLKVRRVSEIASITNLLDESLTLEKRYFTLILSFTHLTTLSNPQFAISIPLTELKYTFSVVLIKNYNQMIIRLARNIRPVLNRPLQNSKS